MDFPEVPVDLSLLQTPDTIESLDAEPSPKVEGIVEPKSVNLGNTGYLFAILAGAFFLLLILYALSKSRCRKA